ncbi:hypothetical protein, conserved [Eimeria maxima]|uniref:Uncharacterized protein n=1 Tax=Eimeria maxima TaxID=5804 RepID=U6M2Q6_EIMMA|nr:hypothetical protein, conserved [Eimeria maxima]CDJ58296.1 hypothetical protein, conserved [Eimeria maxima]
MESSSSSNTPPPTQQQQQEQQQQATLPCVPLPVSHGRVRFDRRMLLVYGLLLLDVVVIGITSLQHVWQPANLIDKVLQNHSTPVHGEGEHRHLSPQLQLPVAVKRELGMSCCCGWLAVAVMADEVELQIKLKYLLVAIASFCVFFALNLIVQIHGRFQQSKVTVAALKTFSSEGNTGAPPIRPADLYGESYREFKGFSLQGEGSLRGEEAFSNPSGAQQNASSSAALFGQGEEGPVQHQSPPYLYWRDFSFWIELSRECFLDGEIQLSSLWVLLHATALVGGRGIIQSRAIVHVAAD